MYVGRCLRNIYCVYIYIHPLYIIFSYMYIYIFIFIKEDSFIYIYGIDMYVYEYIYHFKQQSTRRLYRTIWDILSMYGNPNSFSVHVQYGYIN